MDPHPFPWGQGPSRVEWWLGEEASHAYSNWVRTTRRRGKKREGRGTRDWVNIQGKKTEKEDECASVRHRERRCVGLESPAPMQCFDGFLRRETQTRRASNDGVGVQDQHRATAELGRPPLLHGCVLDRAPFVRKADALKMK